MSRQAGGLATHVVRLSDGSQAFDTAGTFAYACAIHPTMTGTVVVPSHRD